MSQVFNIEGLTCPSCAAQFEENVCKLPNVSRAQVHFLTSKITIEGNATMSELEKAGAFDNLRIFLDGEDNKNLVVPYWRKRENIFVFVAFLLLSLGWITSFLSDEGSIIAISFYLSAILMGGHRLLWYGLKNLIHLRFKMNTLMTIAILGAVLIGEWSEGATVVILFAISEALERYSMDRARNSIRSLMDLTPKQALIRRNESELTVELEDIKVNDILIVKPGQQIAMDGIVVNGASSVNESSITGESIPVLKEEGKEVFAGTLNEEGILEVRITKRIRDRTIDKIIHLVEEAQTKKAPSQTFVDRFAKYYTPSILLLSSLIAIFPPLFLAGNWHEWIYRALAILVVGCPCALVISTPVAIVTAIGSAARQGVLIKGGIYLEELGKISGIAFDKTGTLTQGSPVVTDFIAIDIEEEKVLAQIAALEDLSKHPLASAVTSYAISKEIDFKHVIISNFKSLTGKGISARIENNSIYLGSPKLFANESLAKVKSQIQKWQEEGKTVILYGIHQEIYAMLAIADKVRSESKEAVSQLHQLGVMETMMLTGDNQATAKAIGKEVDITQIFANLMPDQKRDQIKRLIDSGHKIAMVGDGVNDAPALATSTVGITMGGASTDTALETADIVLMGDDLKRLPFAVRLSRRTLNIIKQNVTIALGLKILALLLIIPGLLTLWLAVFADIGGTLLVTLNALRLLKTGN